MRSGRKRSSMWECFTQEGNFVRCKKCNVTLEYCGGSTTKMMYHLGKYHASVPSPEADAPVLSEAPSCAEEDAAETDAARAASASDEPGDEPVDDPHKRKRMKRSSVWDVFVKVKNEAHCTICGTRLKYMSSTTNMIYHIKSKHRNTAKEHDKRTEVADVSHSEVTNLISRMIEKDMLPISMINGDGFRELMSYIVRNYETPSTGDITCHIEAHFQEKTDEIKVSLATVEMMALTTDYWTALPTEKYVTITCHYITEEWQARSVVLQTHSTSVSHSTIDNFTEKLNDTVETWAITGRVIACVHNSAQNSLPAQACASVASHSVVCFASTLQLAITDGLSGGILSVVVAAGKLVKHLNYNSLASKALELKQAQMRLIQHKLIQSSKARWDTICDMFERLVEQRWAIKAVLSDRTVTNRHEAQTFEIEDDSWQIIEDITPVLATLKWVTKVMSAETEMSISNVYPITFSLLQTHLAERQHDAKQVSEFKFKVRESLRKHMEVDSNDLASKPALIASMLDPRHKHLSFLTPTGRLAAKMKLHEMVSKVDVITAKTENQETLVTPVSQVTMSQQKEGDAKNAMMLLLGENYSFSYANDSEAQVDYYLRDISPSLDINPLDWWKINGPRFPTLATLAKRYLCIPGVSVPSNQIFSETGEAFARMRTRLSPEHVDMMIFLNKNM